MHDPGGERVYELRVELTDDDHLVLVRHTARQRAAMAIRWAQPPWVRIGLSAALVLAMAYILGTAIWMFTLNAMKWGSIFLAMFVVLLPFVIRKISPTTEMIERQSVRIMRRALASGVLRLGRRTFEFVATERGIKRSTEDSLFSASWGCVDRIEASSDHVYVYLTSESAIDIPRRCFSSHEESEQFLADAETWLKAARSVNPPPHPVGPSEVVRFE